MPYIPVKRRLALGECDECQSPGELNYVLTQEILDYLDVGYTYADLNEVIGVLECVKLELYARLVRPYEDKAIKRNGDVYE